MVNELLRKLLFGRIKYSVTGGFRDIFFNNCKNMNIRLMNISEGDGYISFECDFFNRKNIEAQINTAGMVIVKIYMTGAPYLISRYKKRPGLLAGPLIFLILITLLSSYIWSIDISGNEKISSDKIIQLLTDSGIYEGVRAEAVHVDNLEFILEKSFPQLLWVDSFVVGSRLFIDIKEREIENHQAEHQFCTNIIATEGGEIISADILSGEGMIKVGDAVAKGDLLVSGTITLKDGRIMFVDSDADIIARTKRNIATQCAKKITVECVEKCKVNYLPSFFGLHIEAYPSDKYNYFTSNMFLLKTYDVTFPLGIERRISCTTGMRDIELTQTQAELIAFSDFCEASLPVYQNAEINNRAIKIKLSKSVVSVECEYICNENICEKQVVEVENKSLNNIKRSLSVNFTDKLPF